MGLNIVGRVVEVRHLPGGSNYGYAYESAIGQFHTIQSTGGADTGASSVPVPGVILRARTLHNHFSILKIGETVEIGDVIKMAPDAVAGLEFIIGGRVGINHGATVKVLSERGVSDDDRSLYHQLMFMRNHISLNKTRYEVMIGTNGGVLGIKG